VLGAAGGAQAFWRDIQLEAVAPGAGSQPEVGRPSRPAWPIGARRPS